MSNAPTPKAPPTPIPWKLGGCSGRMVLYANGDGYVADVDTLANARLIASAPALYEALAAVLAAWKREADAGDGIMEDDMPVYERARSALSAASSESGKEGGE